MLACEGSQVKGIEEFPHKKDTSALTQSKDIRRLFNNKTVGLHSEG